MSERELWAPVLVALLVAVLLGPVGGSAAVEPRVVDHEHQCIPGAGVHPHQRQHGLLQRRHEPQR